MTDEQTAALVHSLTVGFLLIAVILSAIVVTGIVLYIQKQGEEDADGEELF